MKTIKTVIFIAALATLIFSAKAGALEASLESRNFHEFAINVYKIPTDCSASIKRDATITHIQEYVTGRLGQFASIDNSADTPFLSLQVDCMKLEDTRGEGRVIGYTVSMLLQFYRPFFEDVTYVHASPWYKTMLIYIPHESFMQADFEEQLDTLLEEFCIQWLDEHKALPETDNQR
jgi:hypothetical protein